MRGGIKEGGREGGGKYKWGKRVYVWATMKYSQYNRKMCKIVWHIMKGVIVINYKMNCYCVLYIVLIWGLDQFARSFFKVFFVYSFFFCIYAKEIKYFFFKMKKVNQRKLRSSEKEECVSDFFVEDLFCCCGRKQSHRIKKNK